MIEILETFPGVNLIHHRSPDGTLWGTSNRRIRRRRPREGWGEISRFPFQGPRDLLTATRLSARAARVDQSNLYVNLHGNILGIRGGSVFRIEEGSTPFPLGSIQGDSILRRGIGEDSEGALFFGEYFQNRERGLVRIWRVDPELQSMTVAYEFAAGILRHVHGVHADPFDPTAFWVTVGDRDGECFLYRTRDEFRTLERFGDGTQSWRAVSLLFTADHVCWITDSHTQPNVACRMRRSNGALETGQSIDCSGWYATATTDGWYVAFTTVEKGPAIGSDEASILVSRDAFNWKKVGGFRKDFWRPMRVFKYGVISCPSGELSLDDFPLSGEGLIGLDGRSLRVRIVPEG